MKQAEPAAPDSWPWRQPIATPTSHVVHGPSGHVQPGPYSKLTLLLSRGPSTDL